MTLFFPVGPLSGRATSDAVSAKARAERTVASLPACPTAGSPVHMAAVLLLCGREIGQNVDRLARVTGYPREFVARCARRLYDNGVWSAGETVAPWAVDGDIGLAFWSDCQVALGGLCRHADGSGGFEWVAPGACSLRSQEPDPARYPLSMDDPRSSRSEPRAAREEEFGVSWPARRGPSFENRHHRAGEVPDPDVTNSSLVAGSYANEGGPSRGDPDTASPALVCFPDAVWLS